MMKKSAHSIFLFGLIIVMISSCNTSSNLADSSIIQKRRYTKGYHIALKGSQKEHTNDRIANIQVETLEAQDIKLNKPSDSAEASVSTKIVETVLSKAPIAETYKRSELMDDEVVIADFQPDALPVYKEMNEARVSKKEIRKNLRHLRSLSAAPAAAASGESLILYIILAIIIPPLAVGLLYGIGTEFWISLILSFLFYIPGIIYALIKVLQKG